MITKKLKRSTEYYSRDKVRLFLTIFFLVAGIILPSFVSIKNGADREVVSKQYELDLVGEIIRGSSFQERIYIPKHVKKYGVMFATYRRKNTGKIKIEITQGNRKSSEIVDVAKIKDNDYHYLNIRGLKPGEAVLRVEGIDGTIGNAVSMHKTADIMYSEMIQNGEPSQRSFVQKILFSEYNGTVKGQIIFTILSVLCYIYLLSLLWDEERNSRKIYMTTVLLIYLVIASRAPFLTFRVEPFAEQIFNFLYNARTYGIVKNLTLMEGGYLPLFHRIIALLIVKLGFNAKITVYLMSNVAVLVVGMMVSVFMLKPYRKYGDVFYRFVVCMVFGAFGISSTYIETHMFITMAYLNIVPLFYISLLDFKEMKRSRYILLMVLVFLLTLSKFLYVVLLPISVALLVFMWKKLANREKICLGLVSLASVIQILYTYRNRKLWINGDEPKFNIIEAANVVIHQTVQQFINIFNSGIDSSENILNLNILYLIIFLIVLIFLIRLVIRIRSRESVIILCLLGIVFGIPSINALSRIWNGDFELWNSSIGAINTWHSILIKVSILSILVLMPYITTKNSRLRKTDINRYLSYILIAFLIIRFSPFKDNAIFKNDEMASDWSIYSKFYDLKKYLIPVEPYFISENEKISYIGKKSENFAIENFQGKKYFFDELANTEAITGINLPHPMKIEYLYVKRARDYNFGKTRVIGYNQKGERVLDLLQLNKSEKAYVGFHNTGLKVEVSRLEFVTEDNNRTYVMPEIFIGEPLK
ncbi:hypothetical protein JMUB5056_2148 [Leptotrichia hongkongensis]|uniref:Uncharacterized protein n=1 Tax=Leptotrichia hongkongensis TaxID=554406 RepID=A0A510LE54_9FUSO|nr:hypothetical protein [Leptotrichia hongkongensis]BBM60525.1 hypothetical protein JMUB5056_2148 [Leptotrichia hongkongensis]